MNTDGSEEQAPNESGYGGSANQSNLDMLVTADDSMFNSV